MAGAAGGVFVNRTAGLNIVHDLNVVHGVVVFSRSGDKRFHRNIREAA